MRTRHIAAVALVVMAGGALAACRPAPDPVQAPRYARAFALGDSYTAGTGGTNMAWPCWTSRDSWADQLVSSVGAGTYQKLACANARLKDVAGQVAQLPVSPATPTLVLLTVGANDAEFASALQSCVKRDCSADLDASLATRLSALDAVDTLETSIVTRLGPGTKLLVAGYPRPFGTDRSNPTPGCTNIPDVSKTALDRAADALNARLADEVSQARATGADVRFIDPRPALDGHGSCSSEPWLYDPGFPGLGLHLRPVGYAALATTALPNA